MRRWPRPEHPGALAAAACGVLAVAAAVGAGQLVAGLVSPPSSPVLAVGDAAIRLSPQPLTEFAKAAFGTADKAVLLGGMALVLLAAAVGAGLAGRRGRRRGELVLAGLGVLAGAAVVGAPTFAPLDLLAPLAALAAGIGAFRALHAALPSVHRADVPARRKTDLAAGAGSPGGRWWAGPLGSRRRFLGTAAAIGAGAVVAGGAGSLLGAGAGDSRAAVTRRLAAASVRRAPAIPPGADFAAELGTTPFRTSAADFYRIDTALRVPVLRAEDWRLRVHGMVDRELELDFDDLLARPLVERTVTLTCVSNEVNGDLISTADFIGVELRELLREAGPRPGAEQLLSTSTDGWTAGTPVGVVMEEGRGALLAVGMNGEALRAEHGFPVRMIVPGLYGYVSATKWLADLELTTFAARRAYWVQRGWAQRAPVKTQCRIDLPKPFWRLPVGQVTVAGVAWAQPRGIDGVEVSLDGGPWQRAELAAGAGGDTWRMWRAAVEAGPGEHTLRARATDGLGVTQPEPWTDPIPDGATGWPTRVFSAY